MFTNRDSNSVEKLARDVNDLNVEIGTRSDLAEAYRVSNAMSLAAELKNAEQHNALVTSLKSYLHSVEAPRMLHIAYADNQPFAKSIGHVSLMLTEHGFAIDTFKLNRPAHYQVIDFLQLPARLLRYGTEAIRENLIQPDKHNLQYFNITFNEVLSKLKGHASTLTRKQNSPFSKMEL